MLLQNATNHNFSEHMPPPVIYYPTHHQKVDVGGNSNREWLLEIEDFEWCAVDEGVSWWLSSVGDEKEVG